MCLVILAYKHHPIYPLIILANRDEYYSRSTAQAAFWKSNADLLAGKDLQSGGSWMGITRQGKIAILTNFRDPDNCLQSRPSRGELVAKFLQRKTTTRDYLQELNSIGERYNSFNLLFGKVEDLYYFSNKGQIEIRLKPGLHGLSNGFLNNSWPKVVQGKQALDRCLQGNSHPSFQELFTILFNKAQAPDHLLPDTGVGLEKERLLSSIFIQSSDYGTRSSTVLLIDTHGNVYFQERSFNGFLLHSNLFSKTQIVEYSFKLQRAIS